jgi:hypothetical protein
VSSLCRSQSLRAAALLSLGAYLLHELRYAVVYGSHTSEALNDHGHGYLELLGPVAGLLLCLALGSWIAALARAARTSRGEAEPRHQVRAWLGGSASLLAIFIAQESLEGVFAHGHPSGIDAILGDGGWVAGPLALALGAGIALVLRGARAATRRAAQHPPVVVHLLFPAVPAVSVPGAPLMPRPRALARRYGGRGPPQHS